MDYNDLFEDTTIKINPNFCDININDKQLEDEPGIPELKQLYYDKYNYNTANFDDMTSEMKIIYEKDLKIVFEQFSNGDEKFDSEKIKNFSDIKLKNFHNSKGCQSGLYKEKIVGQRNVYLGIRPEHVYFEKTNSNSFEVNLKSELVEYTGHEQIITFNFSEQQFLGKFSSTIDIQMDKDLKLNIDLNQVSLFDKDTQNRI